MRCCGVRASGNTPGWPRRPSPWPIRPWAPAPSAGRAAANRRDRRGRRRRRGRAGSHRRGHQAAHRLRDAARAVRRRAAAHLRRTRAPHRCAAEIARRGCSSPTRWAIPYDDEGWIPGILAPIAESRKDANKIKRKEPITVVIGNPPYKEKAKGRGGWVEGRKCRRRRNPRRWPIGCRRATGASARTQAPAQPLRLLLALGDVEGLRPRPGPTRASSASSPSRASSTARAFRRCAITCAAPRRHLGHRLLARRAPAGSQHAHLPGRAAARLHRACLAFREEQSRNAGHGPLPLAARRPSRREVRGSRQAHPRAAKPGSIARPTGAPRSCRPRPARGPPIRRSKICSSTTAPASCPAAPGSSRPMPIVAAALAEAHQGAGRAEKEALFHPHLRNGRARRQAHQARRDEGACRVSSRVRSRSPMNTARASPPVRYGFRSFDRQWIIPDNRVINQPNPELWRSHSEQQVI